MFILGTFEHPIPWSIHLTTYPSILCAQFDISLFISSADQLGLFVTGKDNKLCKLETDTLDKTGEVYKTSTVPSNIKDEDIIDVFNGFKGQLKQVPPAYSALKLNGKRLYEYARSGIRIIKKSREVFIYSLDLVDYNGFDSILFKTTCSSGTYIRSLAADLAKALGTHGYLEELQRSRVGKYTKEDCLSVEDLISGNIR